ncbi:MAG: NAD-dependent epimerase/dehydratase family protein [Acidobacteriota bacterium]|nr:NAD-dependent epimerase/dehydratase family protein [Acidobacteriota bacterium]
MSVAVITGSSGLIGSEAAKFLDDKGMQIVGIDNDMRKYFFGEEASTAWNTEQLRKTLNNFVHLPIDIRDQEAIFKIFSEYGKDISCVVHTAAQPSHDWAAREPFTDFSVNATGTLIMLEATRRYCPDAAFIFTSTNKVYGDTPNYLPLVEQETRWEIEESHPYFEHGIDENMTVDQSKHSLFGASKVAADLLAQEYGRYFGLKTGTFRGGCLTGPAHAGAELHGFLAYLIKCVMTGKPYTIYGYKGKQVRDNIHSYDLVNAFWSFAQDPKPGAVYNMGGSRHSNCSVLEAIEYTEELCDRKLNFSLSDEARSGDHIWWISDVRRFQDDYPDWSYRYDLMAIIKEIVSATAERASTPASVGK